MAKTALRVVKREPTRRLNVELPQSQHQYLKNLGTYVGLKMSDLVRLAIEVVADHIEDQPRGYRLVAVNKEGKLIKEYILPTSKRRAFEGEG